MTRQMADDEVLRVLHRMVNRADTPDVFHDLRAIHAYVAALQAERDALRSALAGLHNAATAARWPLTAEQMVPMNTARALLAIKERMG